MVRHPDLQIFTYTFKPTEVLCAAEAQLRRVGRKRRAPRRWADDYTSDDRNALFGDGAAAHQTVPAMWHAAEPNSLAAGNGDHDQAEGGGDSHAPWLRSVACIGSTSPAAGQPQQQSAAAWDFIQKMRVDGVPREQQEARPAQQMDSDGAESSPTQGSACADASPSSLQSPGAQEQPQPGPGEEGLACMRPCEVEHAGIMHCWQGQPTLASHEAALPKHTSLTFAWHVICALPGCCRHVLA